MHKPLLIVGLAGLVLLLATSASVATAQTTNDPTTQIRLVPELKDWKIVGLKIAEIKDDCPMARFGLLKGDVLLKINDTPAKEYLKKEENQGYRQIVNIMTGDQKFSLEIRRQNTVFTMHVEKAAQCQKSSISAMFRECVVLFTADTILEASEDNITVTDISIENCCQLFMGKKSVKIKLKRNCFLVEIEKTK